MSCSSNLPPRSPAQNRSPTLNLKPNRPFPWRNSVQEEVTLCLDDFLFSSNSNSRSKETVSLRRAASDPIELLKSGTNEPTCFVDEACVFGPNSPRQKNDINCSESIMAAALLENVNGSPCQELCDPESNPSSFQPSCVSQRTSKRRSRRSRARKMQYISELEKTVSEYEMMGAKLAGSIASEVHNRALLSVENKELNQEILSLQRSKLIKEGQYHYLKNELERLKLLYVQQRKGSSGLGPGPQTGSYNGSSSWQTLNFGKLSIGGT